PTCAVLSLSLHDALPISAHRKATHWIKRINDEYAKMGLDPTLYHVEALLTTTREALPKWKEIVDTYVGLGCRALFLRPVDPFGRSEEHTSELQSRSDLVC